MYKLAEIDAEYVDKITEDLTRLFITNTIGITKGLNFLTSKGASNIGAFQHEIIVTVDGIYFCDADIIYLEKYGWLCDCGNAQFAYPL